MNQLYIEGFSAFAGAFFAFLFLMLAEFINRISKRTVQHYNSLVILDTELNELGGIIHDNLYLIPYFRYSIVNGNIYFSKLRQLPIDKSHYKNLHDIGLINDLFSYNYQLRKLNDDIDSLSEGYKDIKNAYIQHNIQKQDYLVNAHIQADLLTTLEVFLKDMNNRTITMMAKVRLMLDRDVPLRTKLSRWFIHTSGSKITKKEIKKESKRIRKEIENTKSKSLKEIKKAINTYNIKNPGL